MTNSVLFHYSKTFRFSDHPITLGSFLHFFRHFAADKLPEYGGNWSTATVTVHEGLNVGDTTARYLIVDPRP